MISFIITLILAPVLVVTAFFGIEVLAGLKPLPQRTGAGLAGRATIVVPANNEEEVIGSTVAGLRRAAGDACDVIVVADNCTDRTAEKAAEAGALVLIRTNAEHRGKGYALAFAREYLRSDPPEVVLIIDADCRIDGPSLNTLTEIAATSGHACQAVYLFDPVPDGSALVQISTFAFTIKNLVRQRGLQRLARRAHLTGTGMGLPWAVFATADLGGSNIVEDLALGLELAERGMAPLLVEGATVWSPTASAEGTLVQRRRWEGGYLATALKVAPRTFARGVASGDLRAVLAAMDLAVPPLALLFFLNLLGLGVAIAVALFAGSIGPLLAQLAVGALAAAAIILAWAREGRRFASAGTLLRLPIYVLWKIPMYLGFVRRGAPKEWLRPGR